MNPAFERFKKINPIIVALLTIATLGFYVPYWLYTRTRILNQLHSEKPIPPLLISLCMGGYIMMIILVFQIPMNTSSEEIMNSPSFSRLMDAALLLNILQLVWAILFLQRINICTGAKTGEALHGSNFMLILSHLFIVNIYYLQFKINQILDSRQSPTPTIGLM